MSNEEQTKPQLNVKIMAWNGFIVAVNIAIFLMLFLFHQYLPVYLQFFMLIVVFAYWGIKFLEWKIGETIEGLLELFYSVFREKPVKAAMSVLGKRSGESRGSKAASDDLMNKLMSGPGMAGIKLIASQIGFDVDEYIEEHGAVNAVAGLQQVLGLVGVDLKQVILGGGLQSLIPKGLLGSTPQSSGENPYLK